MEPLKKRLEKHDTNRDDPSQWRDGACPFTSTPEKAHPCNPNCALYRSGKKPGYACPFSELTSMSWVIKGSPKKGDDRR